MPHIATKINCEGDKCGECEKRRYLKHMSYYETNGVCKTKILYQCIQFGKEVDKTRLPECLAAELVKDCNTCENNSVEHGCLLSAKECAECVKNKLKYWQPATKGE